MSGPFVALNGRRVVSGQLTFPYYGIWTADVVLSVPDTISTQTTLTLGDLTLQCFVYRQLSSAGSRSARIAGGFGGWLKQVPAQGYSGNVSLSTALRDAALLVGEQISVSADRSLGNAFTREAGPAQRLLRQLAGPIWWIDAKGVTQVGPRTTTTVSSPFTVVEWSGAKGKFEIATEKLSDWMPGAKFSNSNITTTQTVSTTSIDIDNSGKLRLMVLATP